MVIFGEIIMVSIVRDLVDLVIGMMAILITVIGKVAFKDDYPSNAKKLKL
jgi:hypothetical protein